MSSGTAGAAGFTSAAGFSGVASPQPARKHAARMPKVTFRQVVRRRPRVTRFFAIALPVPDGKDGFAAGSLAGARKQPRSVRYPIVEVSLLLFLGRRPKM